MAPRHRGPPRPQDNRTRCCKLHSITIAIRARRVCRMPLSGYKQETEASTPCLIVADATVVFQCQCQCQRPPNSSLFDRLPPAAARRLPATLVACRPPRRSYMPSHRPPVSCTPLTPAAVDPRRCGLERAVLRANRSVTITMLHGLVLYRGVTRSVAATTAGAFTIAQ
ncbi:unnamed protein product [Danaus chrysippus]|uniref:(African queen) hypothetical protein n=1 Tax=Danaus chrysippus TaxID=151541 RepID=A0A8J2QM83_9NEOP|nr:unnamed protein product [Danaus chrysippus]